MAFEVRDYYDFVRLLYQHPEWQEELGNLLIAKEIRELPQIVRQLAEAHQRSEERLTRLEQAVAELTEAQKRSEERLTRLEQAVAELTEAQKRSEERLTQLEQAVAELAEAQKRTEQRVEELAEAQKRTEQRVEELAEAQKRTEQRVEELAEAQKRTEKRIDQLSEKLGRLENLIGASLESEAAEMLLFVLEQKGYVPISEPVPLALNGEVDVIVRVRDAEGQEWTAALESKVRLGGSDVRRWADRMSSSGFQNRLKRAGYPGPYLVYMYGIRINEMALKAAKDRGVGLIKSNGEICASVRWGALP